jgi:hypothetical protein
MSEDHSTDKRVYRVGTHLLVVVGVFALFFTTLGILIVVKKGDWNFLAIIVGGFAVFFLLLQVLRLEIGSDGFKYRNLSGSRTVLFADVRRAYIEVERANKAPQGVAVFWVERRDERRVKVNLRTFPMQAAADLFTALETHDIQIEVPDEWAARRTVDQIRAAQAKLRP